MKCSAILFAVFFLVGCNNGEGIGMYESPMWHATADTSKKVAYFKRQCLEFGFEGDTPEMAQCIQNQMNQSSSAASDQMEAHQNRTRTTTVVNNTYNNNAKSNNSIWGSMEGCSRSATGRIIGVCY
jgi:hypothetical protein